MELLGALNELRIAVHEDFIWLHFVDNLPAGYRFIKNSLDGLKDPLTRIELEDALSSKYKYYLAKKR